MNETIGDIIREMRNDPVIACLFLADRIEAAYWRDMKTVADEVARLKKQVSELCHFGVCRSEKCSCCDIATEEVKE